MTHQPGQPTDNLNKWQKRVENLIAQISSWAEKEGWETARSDVEIHEDSLGDYRLPQLRVSVAGGQATVLVRPVGLNIIGGDGRIDLESWPSLNRFKIVGRGESWQLYTDSNVRWPKEWGRETCLELMRNLADDRAA